MISVIVPTRRLAGRWSQLALGHDGGMNIEARAEYPADPTAVFTLITDQEFLEQVCERTHARDHRVTVDGNTVTTSRTLPAPDQARPFTGDTLTVIEEIAWEQPRDDGSRSGVVSMSVPGQPVTLTGQYRLDGDGGRTVMTLSGELKVNVPMLGKKLEQAAEPAVLHGFRTQEKVATDWL